MVVVSNVSSIVHGRALVNVSIYRTYCDMSLGRIVSRAHLRFCDSRIEQFIIKYENNSVNIFFVFYDFHTYLFYGFPARHQ